MRVRTRLLSLIVVIALTMLLLSNAFSGITSSPLSDKPPRSEDPDAFPWVPLAPLDISNISNSEEVLFKVIGANGGPVGLAYLRTGVYVNYSMGVWESFTENSSTYIEGTSIEVEGGSSATLVPHYLYIQPVQAISSSLPIAKDTTNVTLEDDLVLSYDQETQIMNVQGEVVSPYRVGFYLPSYDEAALRAAGTAPEDRYLGVPSALAEKLRILANAVAQGEDSAYGKAVALAEFLKSNYTYDRNVSAPPEGTDPLEWFLFDGKVGADTHFNTAFVMLARSLNIPTRLVSGYLLDPNASEQNVTLAMARTYAEIRLDGMGWVLFDATPPPEEDPDDPPSEDDETSISGHVYVDSNENGVMDEWESTLSNCTVVLRDRLLQNIILSAQTNESGAYSFAPVEPGEYWVEAFPPEGYEVISPNPTYVDMRDQPEVRNFGVVPDEPERPRYTVTNITQWEEVVGKGSAFFVNGTVTIVTMPGYPGRPQVSGLQVLVYLAVNKTSGPRTLIGEATLHDGIYSASCRIPDDIGLGEFQLIARTIGGTVDGVEYASSESDPTINVTDSSELSLEGPSRALSGRDTIISVTLRESASGRPVAGAPVEVWVGDRHETYTTGPDGAFNFTVRGDAAGTVRPRAVYQGTESLGPANASLEVELLSATVDASVAGLVLVRGEVATISGWVHAGDLPADGEEVVFRLGEGLEVRGLTDRQGWFTISLEVPRSTGLGPTFAAIETGLTAPQTYEVSVKSRTTLEARLEGNVLVAVLTDDSGAPVGGQQIELRFGTASGTVRTGDLNGTARYGLGSERPASVNGTYGGDPRYLPSTISLSIAPLQPQSPSPSWSWQLLLPLLLVVPLVVAGAVHHRKRSAAPPPGGPAPLAPPGAVLGASSSPYALSFPQAAPLPDVWGEGDPLLVEVRGPDGTVTVSVDGKDTAALELRQGAARLYVDLPRGEHIIGVAGAPGRGERKVRIARYRDEVIRRYGEALGSWKAAWPDLPDDLTPREISRALGEKAGPEGAEGLAESAVLFERAEYSNHAVTRKDFENMHHALDKVKV